VAHDREDALAEDVAAPRPPARAQAAHARGRDEQFEEAECPNALAHRQRSPRNLPEFLLTGLRAGGAERQRLSNGRPPPPHEMGRSVRAPNALSPTTETGHQPGAYRLTH
jgi:hypothetical protein